MLKTGSKKFNISNLEKVCTLNYLHFLFRHCKIVSLIATTPFWLVKPSIRNITFIHFILAEGGLILMPVFKAVHTATFELKILGFSRILQLKSFSLQPNMILR